MPYLRVIPRDLFNEANLLKCWGKLWIALEGRLGDDLAIEHDGDEFRIDQDESDGSIFVENVKLRIRGYEMVVTRPVNSRESWPLVVQTDEEIIRIFDEKTGELSKDFLRLIEVF